MNKEVSVVIPYYRGEKYLVKCLKSIEESSLIPSVVYIIDNCPKGIDDQVLSGNFQLNIRLIKTQKGIGFARACNIGIKFAFEDGFKYILFLNQDGFLEKDAIELLLKNISTDVYVSAPLSLKYDQSGFSEFYSRTYLIWYLEILNDLFLQKLKGSYLCGPKSFNGSCILMSLLNFEKIKYFDSRFYMYGEEHDLFVRAHKKGLSFSIVPFARFYHIHSNSSSTGDEAAINRLLISQGVFVENFQNLKGLAFLKNLFKVFLCKSLLIAFVTGRFKVLPRMIILHISFLRKVPSFIFFRSEDEINFLAEKAIQKDFIRAINFFQ